jgi:hypothetical protein
VEKVLEKLGTTESTTLAVKRRTGPSIVPYDPYEPGDEFFDD